MKKTFIFFGLLLFLWGCELFVIGTASKKIRPVEVNQKSPIGTIYLFKTELDSNNIPAATKILATPKGTQYLAIEKLDLYDEVERLGRILSNKPITYIRADSLTQLSYKVSVEFDYIHKMSFTTYKIDDAWFITEYGE
ncbi:MAG: hypothetical protein A2X61_03535 [Ignavibacteria bacterium GWB2_35_12]|nr:MAG: hypothetical protein A2X63_10205 [Ignavibacteria bacterium GWA2_35_8]OGU42108.1 MAG: hypothetical protein A2X61_03535 [Ignavibacteria bacterium GWB2_35_12]OGU95589.1 MAG: hypothetical protein A2220_06480 [Ignavibacteria bacterium RIFOXYA2_FULL_35_10]OGV20242.1 MAG: hypothetical protein A2475_07815 [Ignavibacteria bacterium RIFOXYC2_FULL_35_21]